MNRCEWGLVEEGGEVGGGGEGVGSVKVGACLPGLAGDEEIVADVEEGCEVVGVEGEDVLIGGDGFGVLSCLHVAGGEGEEKFLTVRQALEHDAGIGDDAPGIAPEEVILEKIGVNGAPEPGVGARDVGEECFVEVGMPECDAACADSGEE